MADGKADGNRVVRKHPATLYGLFVGVRHPFCTGPLARWLEMLKSIE